MRIFSENRDATPCIGHGDMHLCHVIDQLLFFTLKPIIMSVQIFEPVNVRSFGAVGDGVNDDTQAFLNALDLLHQYEKGVLYVPTGTYNLTQRLEINKPYISIKGDGMQSTILQFNGDGIKLSDFSTFTFATVEDLTLAGNGNASSGVPGTGTALALLRSHQCFINRVYMHNFDIAISVNESVLTRLDNFSILGCRQGIVFSNSSFASTVLHGNISGCREAGIVDDQTGVYIANTDIEAIGGPAINASYGTRIRDCHIESSAQAIAIHTHGGVTVEDSTISGCVTGVKRTSAGAALGQHTFRNLKFSNVTTEFDIQGVHTYQIEDCLAFDALGGAKTPVYNVDQGSGYIKYLRGIINQGEYLAYNVAGMEINGVPVARAHKFTLTGVNIGTIAANTTSQFVETVPTGFAMDEFKDTLTWGFSAYNTPPGVLFSVGIKQGTTDQILINVTNTTASSVSVGSPTFLINLFKNVV